MEAVEDLGEYMVYFCAVPGKSEAMIAGKFVRISFFYSREVITFK